MSGVPAFALDAALRGRVRLGLLALDGATVRESEAALRAAVEAAGRTLRERFSGKTSGELPETAAARSLYKALGIDPTKTRPSNEALLRRVLKGEPLAVVNTLVDALNLVCLETQLPFGLYDAARIVPPVLMRLGRAGEGYPGIRKGLVNVEARPVLVDAQGPFGNPSSDSLRTSITLETSSALVVAYAPAATSDRRLGEILDLSEATLCRFCGGAAAGRAFV